METIGVTSVSFSNNKNLVHNLKLSHPKAKIILSKTKRSRSKLIDLIKRCDKMIVGLDTIDKHAISYAKKLKTISKYGVGLNNIDLKECNKRKLELFILRE